MLVKRSRWKNSFLNTFLWRDTIVFRKMSLFHWFTKLSHQTIYREETIGEVVWRQWCYGDWALKTMSEIAFCFILFTGFVRICKNLIYGKRFWHWLLLLLFSSISLLLLFSLLYCFYYYYLCDYIKILIIIIINIGIIITIIIIIFMALLLLLHHCFILF